jgi:H+/Na+-translocating ferredoxin:NAD+ oxidoreductase subunit B
MVKPKAKVDGKLCLSCGGCVSVCPQDAIQLQNLIAYVNQSDCISCNICFNTCPIGAIFMEDM